MDTIEKYAILVVSGDMIIGEMSEVEGRKVLRKPLLLVHVTNGNQVGVRLIDMVGVPRYVNIPKGALWYFVEDAKIIELYLRVTTGLVIGAGGGVR